MGMQLNTGDTGRAVSPAADGSLYSKIFGSGCYVLSGGNELKAEIQSNNLIKIYDGDLIMQGRHSYIPASDSDNVTINNGSQGMNRKDLIVARYTKDSTGVEDVTLQVVQGTATSGAATAPGYTDGDILKGATAKDFPLYEVSLTGINITEVKKLFKVLGTNEDLADKVTELNGKSGKLIENKIDYQEYTLFGGKVRVISGSVIRTGAGKNYIALFSAEQLKDYFGVTVNTTRLSISTFNGDDASQAVQFYAPENWQGSIYQYFSAVVSGSIRINYRMVYVYE